MAAYAWSRRETRGRMGAPWRAVCSGPVLACLLALTLTLLTLALICTLPTLADAQFSQAGLLSGTASRQFDEANAPVLSADGRYAVFQGSLLGTPGIYRRDLRSGAVEMVAGADATGPSVSAAGRYVAFTSTAEDAVEPASDRGCPEVYVRDMEPGPGEPEYVLAAALNGTTEGIAYESGCAPSLGVAFSASGAQAAAGVALSADGRHVVFTVLSVSNLEGAGTEPSQVAVRDLDTDTTTLVTSAAGRPVSGGGAFPSLESLGRGRVASPTIGLGGPSLHHYGDQATASTAAISADASTVAWLGTDVPAQVSAAEAERSPSLPGPDPAGLEVEPLWRRVADGVSTPTRRLLAGAGLDFFYAGINERAVDPVIAGSFVGMQESALFIAPTLSADGRVATVLASAPPPAVEPSLNERKNTGLSDLDTDAYAVHVGADPASPVAVTPLTEIASYMLPDSATEDVKDVAISADGTRVAFDTARTQLRLPALASISPPIAYTQMPETYEANLALGTLQRVTATYDGSEPNGEAGLLAFAGDGQALTFASSATNLFFGDGIGAWEVYLVRELASEAAPAPEEIGAPPLAPNPTPSWTLDATATAMRDGSVLVQVQTPGAGRLVVKAAAQLSTRSAKVARRNPHARAGRTGRRRQSAHAASARTVSKAVRGKAKRRAPGGRTGAAITARTVAQSSATVPAAATTRLHLRVSTPYRALVAARNGLYAVLSVKFTAPGQRTLLREIPVTFHLKRKPVVRRRVKR
jgi:hypothetical protein